MSNIKIKDGKIVPDINALNELIFQLKARMDKDIKLAKMFKDDPNRVLAALGFALDVREEIITRLTSEIDKP